MLSAEIIERQGLALPASVILPLLPPSLQLTVTPESLGGLLRTSADFAETSPGMFTLRRSIPNLDRHRLPNLPLSAGTQLESVLRSNPPLATDDALRLFKRATALNEILRSIGDDTFAVANVRRIDEQWKQISARYGWSLIDIDELAKGSRPVKADPSESEQTTLERRRFLVSVYVADLALTGDKRSRAAEYHAIREQLICRNIRLVAQIARSHAHGGFMRYSDLFQEGCIGLIHAIDRYDPYRGYQFSTYATWWIRQAITRAIADKERVIRLPVHVVERVNRLFSETAVDDNYYLTEPETQEEEKLQTVHLNRWARPVGSIGIESQHGDDAELASAIDSATLRMAIDSALGQLPRRARLVLHLRLGLGAFGDQATLQEVGDRLGLTRERVRQIESRWLKTLKRLLTDDGPKPQEVGQKKRRGKQRGRRPLP